PPLAIVLGALSGDCFATLPRFVCRYTPLSFIVTSQAANQSGQVKSLHIRKLTRRAKLVYCEPSELVPLGGEDAASHYSGHRVNVRSGIDRPGTTAGNAAARRRQRARGAGARRTDRAGAGPR